MVLALSIFPELSVLGLGNAVTQILMAAAQLCLPYSESEVLKHLKIQRSCFFSWGFAGAREKNDLSPFLPYDVFGVMFEFGVGFGWFFGFFLSFCSNNISGYLALIHDIIMIWFLQYSCLVSCFVLHVWTAVSFLKYRALLLLLLNFVLMTSGRFGSLLSLEDRIRLCNRVLAKSSSSALFKNCINTLFHHQR